MFVDMPLDQLRGYLPERREPADFDAFWERTLAGAREHDLGAVFEPYATDLAMIDVYDVTFAGFGGDPIKGWYLKPAALPGPLPCVVEFIGYGGGRGLPHDWLLWPSAGYAAFVMDTRGQGGGWRSGDTPDPAPGTGPQTSGKMTQGIFDPDGYYYRRLYTDVVRAVEAARAHPATDPGRVAVAGGSQGGAMALAASALVPDLAYAFVNVPFMCHIRHAVEITDEDPYAEVGRFLAVNRTRVDQVFATLDYFDGLNFAVRSRTPARFSVGLRDGVTPPSTVFAAYNHYAGPKDISVWPFNGHEGGDSQQALEVLAVARKVLG
ncbi:cephalosporin-C deacetylase [Microbispora corallina]|uniref:Cephalosporin-C deacetylase n=1 Tax=Microbispora corallina TaxID=83302 RepID=A0ABQ4G573_9ACTN|nr:acetylxylan esterase [Microbispora corallina]GIH42189.1 cephalosporin-C deacetylase [Microbispora corallina]